jgi:hypothetical protein
VRNPPTRGGRDATGGDDVGFDAPEIAVMPSAAALVAG